MRTIQFIPGLIVTPNAITLPTSAPDIEAVVSAEIERLPSSLAAHAAGAAVDDHAAADIAGALANHVGADPVVAAVPTRLTTRTFSLDVSTALGDLLTINYLEVGERVLVS